MAFRGVIKNDSQLPAEMMANAYDEYHGSIWTYVKSADENRLRPWDSTAREVSAEVIVAGRNTLLLRRKADDKNDY
jgi:hypothetical protein